MGACSEFFSLRCAIHASSAQSYSRSHTTDAVRGGFSYSNPNGSVLSPTYPLCCETIWNLYSAPLVTPGTNPSQTPEPPRACSRCACGSQRLKLPITETSRAFGAHTLKHTPGSSPASVRCAPSLL